MYDVVIVGAGLAGLTAGAKLAKEGQRVCVLEKHARPGGCATTYRRKRYEVEVSLHMVDGFDDLDCKGPILRDLGVWDDLEFVPVPRSLYRFAYGDRDVEIPFGLEAAIERLSERYPEDRRAIGQVLRRMSKVRRELSSFPYSPKAVSRRIPIFPFLYPNFLFAMRGSLGRYLDQHFRAEELKLALSGDLAFFHDDPYTISAKFFGVAQAAFLEAGACYLKGGSQRLSNRLRDVIEAHGGEVRLRHRVTRLHTERGRVCAVEFEHGSEARRETGRVEGRQVLANAAVPQVLDELLAPDADRGLRRRVGTMKVASSVSVLHVGFRTPLRELGNRHYTTMLFDPSVRTLRDVAPNARGPWAQRTLGFTDYSQLDSGLAPEGKSLAAVCAIDYMDAWEGLSDAEYAAKKAQVTDVLLDRVEALVPGSRQQVEFAELGTPRTVRRYTLNTAGSIGGFVQSERQSLLRRYFRVRSSLKNLHFAGAWQFPGGGYTCAMLGGYLQGVLLLESRL
ncbi:MAG: NAD(P)/FAD-dependent oxidoreductase [Myxococcota bacterium]